jgi:hypothetical protein
MTLRMSPIELKSFHYTLYEYILSKILSLPWKDPVCSILDPYQFYADPVQPKSSIWIQIQIQDANRMQIRIQESNLMQINAGLDQKHCSYVLTVLKIRAIALNKEFIFSLTKNFKSSYEEIQSLFKYRKVKFSSR